MDDLEFDGLELDELSFRRKIFADPKSRDEDIAHAKKSAPKKQQLARELEQLDDKITQALNVPVPDHLYEKLILRQTMQDHQQQKRKKRVHLAMAASIAVAFGVLLNSFLFTSAYSTLGEHAIAHVEHENISNQGTTFVSLATLNEKLADFNGALEGISSATVSKLLAAEFCWFDGMKSLHLVFQGENSPITVLVVPDNEQLKFTANFSNNNLHGKAQQVKAAGINLIVVGDKSENTDSIQESLSKNIRWQA